MKIAWMWLAVALVPAVALAQRADEARGEEMVNTFAFPHHEAASEKEDTPWKEGAYALPARPDERNLRAFSVGASAPGRFLLDTKSLASDEDGVIRYVLVTRSSSGNSSATFEGIRCNANAGKGFEFGQLLGSVPGRRFYASAGQDGEWHPFKNSEWQALDSSSKDPRVALAVDYFCDGPAARTRAEILLRLRDGTRVDFLDPRRAP
jgi:hypothetical protein